jgi:hypothetical protein
VLRLWTIPVSKYHFTRSLTLHLQERIGLVWSRCMTSAVVHSPMLQETLTQSALLSGMFPLVTGKTLVLLDALLAGDKTEDQLCKLLETQTVSEYIRELSTTLGTSAVIRTVALKGFRLEVMPSLLEAMMKTAVKPAELKVDSIADKTVVTESTSSTVQIGGKERKADQATPAAFPMLPVAASNVVDFSASSDTKRSGHETLDADAPPSSHGSSSMALTSQDGQTKGDSKRGDVPEAAHQVWTGTGCAARRRRDKIRAEHQRQQRHARKRPCTFCGHVEESSSASDEDEGFLRDTDAKTSADHKMSDQERHEYDAKQEKLSLRRMQLQEQQAIINSTVGASASSIATHMVNCCNVVGCGQTMHYTTHYPSDSSDFGRCMVFLNRFPKCRSRMGEMARGHGWQWRAIAPHWDELEQIYLAEIGARTSAA